MPRRRPDVPQRKPVFVGCEGESERGYVVFLQKLMDQHGLAVHLDAVLLKPGAGDPLRLVQLAEAKLSRKRSNGQRYSAAYVLLDIVGAAAEPEREDAASVWARRNGLLLVRQDPCHEALLLTHLEGCATLRPPSAAAAERELSRRWPEYFKGLPASRLAERLDARAVRQAADGHAELKAFLAWLGFRVS